MRFLDLQLQAFGPFSGVVLDFSTMRGGVHVVYGNNAAGKSTALRALTSLLFGIPRTTRDDHVHRPAELRIGARIETAAGEILHLVRRKGERSTLRDGDGEPVDERILSTLMGGVSRELFLTLFGLDQESLRHGAEAMLEGRGHAGESLLEAGLGGGGLHRVLEELRTEADALFKPRGVKTPLNEAIRAFREARSRTAESSLSEQGWVEQDKALVDRRDERARAEEQLRTLRARQKQLLRAQGVLPLLAHRRVHLERLHALASAPLLPEGAVTVRRDAERQALEGEGLIARLDREIALLEQSHGTLRVPTAILSHADAIDALPDRLGTFRKAARDLPRLRADLQSIEAEAAAVIRQLGRAVELDQVEAIGVGVQSRIHKLARDRAGLEAQLETVGRAASERLARRDADRKRLRELPASASPGPLRRAASRAREQGDRTARRAAVLGEVEQAQRAVARAAVALGLVSGSAEEIAGRSLPGDETIERYERRSSQVQQQTTALVQADKALRARRAEVDRGLAALRRDGEVPSRDELALARARRQRGWELVLDAWRSAPRAPEQEEFCEGLPLADAYAESVRRADDLVDRLSREADRVATLERLLFEQREQAREAQELEADHATVQREAAALATEWRAVWAPAGIEPLGPSEMKLWLARHRTLIAALDTLEAAKGQAEELGRAIEERRGELLAVLGAEGVALASAPGLHALIDRAEACAASLDERLALAGALDAGLQDLDREIAVLEVERAQKAALLEALNLEWARSVVVLGLGQDASAEEATELLQRLGELFRMRADADRLKRRIAGMGRDMAEFADEVGRLVTVLAPDRSAAAPDEAAAELVRVRQKAAQDEVEARQIQHQLSEKRALRAEAAERVAQASAVIDGLMREARVVDRDALEGAERDSEDKRRAQTKLGELEEQLAQIGGGATVESLASEFVDLGVDAVAVELEELEVRLPELEQERKDVEQSIGAIEAQITRWKSESPSTRPAAEAQEHLARVKRLADRYLCVRLAALVLAREIERYRERNQGPILGRASELFRRLSMGTLVGLRVELDERGEAVLRCVGADQKLVDVAGLSDGTRDQLYLALRLASLERHAGVGEGMPLVLDDVLIHFDDDRARVALEILGELAGRMQILFFTHHARIVDLARSAVPQDRLHEHRLSSLPGASQLPLRL